MKKVLYAAIILLIFGLGMGTTYLYFNEFNNKVANGSSNGACYTKCENKVTITENGISTAVDKIYDAVAIVEVYKGDKLSSTGTGFIYKKDNNFGYLITNYHVAGNSEKIKLTLSTDEKVDATYVGGDQYMDISILKIPAEKVKKVAEIGDSSQLKLGDTVFTIGTPVDYEYRGTVTRGILSGKDRLVTVSLSGHSYDWAIKVMQTDAAINPGNSGGPLCNSNGEVIGVNTLKIVNDSIEGMGFSIPIEDVMIHITELENGSTIERPYLGISMINAAETLTLIKNNIEIDESITKGVVVASVEKGSPSYGILQQGDIITKINKYTTDEVAYLKYALFKNKPGDIVTITYTRKNKSATAKITLSKAAN